MLVVWMALEMNMLKPHTVVIIIVLNCRTFHRLEIWLMPIFFKYQLTLSLSHVTGPTPVQHPAAKLRTLSQRFGLAKR